MLQSWAGERRRLLAVMSAGLLAGWASGYWAICILVASSGYLLWQLRQLKELSDWVKKGANMRRAPDLSGAWHAVVRHIYTIQRRNRKRKAKLQGLLSRFEQISVALPDGTVVLRDNHEIDWANTVAGSLLGIRFPQDSGRRIENLVRNPQFQHYLANRDYTQPLNIPSPVSDEIELSIRMIPFGNDELLLTARDISTFSQVQAMRRDFVANVSHELRTPLTVIGGYLEALLDDDRLDAEVVTALRSIHQQSHRMQHIVEDLLELSRLESEIGELSETEVHVPSLLSVLMSEAVHLSQFSGHKVFTEIDENLCLQGGEKEISSLASNLVHNAIRHTPSGTQIRIKWFQDAETRGAVLIVKDNGHGIEREHIPRLTERFYRVDTGRSRDVGGSGLGLSIVKHIMLRHGGQLQINSRVGEGSEFICRFPVERVILVPVPKRVIRG